MDRKTETRKTSAVIKLKKFPRVVFTNLVFCACHYMCTCSKIASPNFASLIAIRL